MSCIRQTVQSLPRNKSLRYQVYKNFTLHFVDNRDQPSSEAGSDSEGAVGSVYHGVAAVTSPLHTEGMQIQGYNLKFLLDGGALSLLSAIEVDTSRLQLSNAGTHHLKNTSDVEQHDPEVNKVITTQRVQAQDKMTHLVIFDIIPEKRALIKAVRLSRIWALLPWRPKAMREFQR